jgi:hypothetical protein
MIEAIYAPAPHIYLTNMSPSTTHRRLLPHAICPKKSSNLLHGNREESKPLPRLHLQVIIILHPSHLTTPCGPLRRQVIQEVEGLQIQRSYSPLPSSTSRNHNEGERGIMKQEKEIWQTKSKELKIQNKK